MNRRSLLPLVILIFVALFLVQCSPQPAAPEQVEVTRIVEQTVEEVVEVTRIVEREVEVEGEAVEVTRVVEVPAEPLIVRIAFPSIIDVDDVAALLAFEAMAEEGFPVVPTFYAQGELAAAAVAAGQADMGAGAATVWLNAINNGAPIAGIMEQAANGWSVVSRIEIEDCADVDGQRTAIHSEGSVSTAMLYAWIDSTCPEIEPEILVIPGSENRAAALLAGEIDVTPAELIDSVRIMELAPGEYHRIANFAVDLSGLRTGGFWVNRDFAEAHPEAVRAFIRNVLEIHRRIADEPDWFQEQVPRFLDMSEEDLAVLPTIVEALLANDNYPVNGGLTEENAQYTLDFFTDSGALEPGLTMEEAYDLTALNDVLAEIGER